MRTRREAWEYESVRVKKEGYEYESKGKNKILNEFMNMKEIFSIVSILSITSIRNDKLLILLEILN